jgi:hypothetical protein
MTRSLQPIPTTFRGYRFRSRLEARWAVAFDAIGLRWDYEPEGFKLRDGTCYLPDFWFPQTKCWAEVKPNGNPAKLVITPAAARKACLLALESGHPTLILDGPPRDTNYWCATADPMEPTGVEWFDVNLFDANHYHESEGRFFMCTGVDFPEHSPEGLNDWFYGPEIHPAVLAARSARFEHGERP